MDTRLDAMFRYNEDDMNRAELEQKIAEEWDWLSRQVRARPKATVITAIALAIAAFYLGHRF